jgi:hypothetical protein
VGVEVDEFEKMLELEFEVKMDIDSRLDLTTTQQQGPDENAIEMRSRA